MSAVQPRAESENQNCSGVPATDTMTPDVLTGPKELENVAADGDEGDRFVKGPIPERYRPWIGLYLSGRHQDDEGRFGEPRLGF